MLLYGGAPVAFNEENQKHLKKNQKRTDVIPKDYYGLQQRYKYISLQYSFKRQTKNFKETKKGKKEKSQKRKENFFAKTSKPEPLPHSKLKMEHLDLAGYMNTPVNWNLGAFEQQGE